MLVTAGVLPSAVAQAPRITEFKLEAGRRLSVAWSGSTNPVVVQTSVSLSQPDWQAVPGTAWPVVGTNYWSGILPAERASDFVRLVVQPPHGPPLPSQTLSLDLIGIHDLQSSAYNGDCISCHGDRLNEKALDGVTPAAHSTMRTLFGSGNERCISCHQTGSHAAAPAGPDFLTWSAASVRKQVSIVLSDCANCHRKGKPLEFYDNTFIP